VGREWGLGLQAFPREIALCDPYERKELPLPEEDSRVRL